MKIINFIFSISFSIASIVYAQESILLLDTNCTVSLLNRNAKVQADGTFKLFNVPAGLGKVKVRANCVDESGTRYGESQVTEILQNEVTGVGTFQFQFEPEVPTNLLISSTSVELKKLGETTQITTIAILPSGQNKNVTSAENGSTYLSTNPKVASIDSNGLVTALSSGRVLITVSNDGILKTIIINVQLSSDSDGDGIPDDYEIANGLNPFDSTDASLDSDGDGLTNLQEYKLGTNIHLADTDGDGIPDGEEVVLGKDGYITDPLNADTDGDGYKDGLEILVGTDPTNSSNFSLQKSIKSIQILPGSFTFYRVQNNSNENVRLVQVQALLKDNSIFDITKLGTKFTSSDSLIISPSVIPGTLTMGANNGVAKISAVNNGFTAAINILVQPFSTKSLSFIETPGSANGLALSKGFAYIASGSAGIQIVDISNPNSPVKVGTYHTLGNANNLKIIDTLLYVADSGAGVEILNISSPINPTQLSSKSFPDPILNLNISGNILYLVDGKSLTLLDVSNPLNPMLLSNITLPGFVSAVDILSNYAVVAAGLGGVRILDIKDSKFPIEITFIPSSNFTSQTSLNNPVDVKINGTTAYISDRGNTAGSFSGIKILDLSNITIPKLIDVSSFSNSNPTNIATDGNFAIFAAKPWHTLFGIDISNPLIFNYKSNVSTPSPPNFTAETRPVNVQTRSGLAYVLVNTGKTNYGSLNQGGLAISQLDVPRDNVGLPPNASVISPKQGDSFMAGTTFEVVATATDDKGLSAVDFTLNGVVVATSFTPPYKATITVPSSGDKFYIGINAIDFGSSTGKSALVELNILPDPGVQIVGHVTPYQNYSITNTKVTCGEVTSDIDADGKFSFHYPVSVHPIDSCYATLKNLEGEFFGYSNIKSVPLQGKADIGEILLSARPQITNVTHNIYPVPGVTIPNFRIYGRFLNGHDFQFVDKNGTEIEYGLVWGLKAKIDSSGTFADLSFYPDSGSEGEYSIQATTTVFQKIDGIWYTTPVYPLYSDINTLNIKVKIIDRAGDPDRDGLLNVYELLRHTDPFNFDTDGDGFGDGYEVSLGSDPLNVASIPKIRKQSEAWSNYIQFTR